MMAPGSAWQMAKACVPCLSRSFCVGMTSGILLTCSWLLLVALRFPLPPCHLPSQRAPSQGPRGYCWVAVLLIQVMRSCSGCGIGQTVAPEDPRGNASG